MKDMDQPISSMDVGGWLLSKRRKEGRNKGKKRADKWAEAK
jgi:hypothetical protein